MRGGFCRYSRLDVLFKVVQRVFFLLSFLDAVQMRFAGEVTVNAQVNVFFWSDTDLKWRSCRLWIGPKDPGSPGTLSQSI